MSKLLGPGRKAVKNLNKNGLLQLVMIRYIYIYDIMINILRFKQPCIDILIYRDKLLIEYKYSVN